MGFLDLVDPEIKTMSTSFLYIIFNLGSTNGSIALGLLTVSLLYNFLIGGALNLSTLPVIYAMRKKKT